MPQTLTYFTNTIQQQLTENIYAALYYFLWKVNDPFGEMVTCADSIFVFREKKTTMKGGLVSLQIKWGVQISPALS